LPTGVGLAEAGGGDEGPFEADDGSDDGGRDDEPNRCIPTATPETAAAAAEPSRTRRVMVFFPRWAGVT
jgi:hypothetical protein